MYTTKQHSGVQEDIQVQVFRDSEQSLQHQHRWRSPWEVQSDSRSPPDSFPGEGVQDPGDFPGSRLGFGAQIYRAQGLFAALC